MLWHRFRFLMSVFNIFDLILNFGFKFSFFGFDFNFAHRFWNVCGFDFYFNTDIGFCICFNRYSKSILKSVSSPAIHNKFSIVSVVRVTTGISNWFPKTQRVNILHIKLASKIYISNLPIQTFIPWLHLLSESFKTLTTH